MLRKKFGVEVQEEGQEIFTGLPVICSGTLEDLFCSFIHHFSQPLTINVSLHSWHHSPLVTEEGLLQLVWDFQHLTCLG